MLTLLSVLQILRGMVQALEAVSPEARTDFDALPGMCELCSIFQGEPHVAIVCGGLKKLKPERRRPCMALRCEGADINLQLFAPACDYRR